MDFDPVLLAPRRARMVAAGLWHDRTINDALDACLVACPEKLALTAWRLEPGAPAEPTRFTYREMARMADRIAVGLSRLGVGRNDVVACQLPNWWQFTLTYNHFIGDATPFVNYTNLQYASGNTLADRDFVAFSLRRTF